MTDERSREKAQAQWSRHADEDDERGAVDALAQDELDAPDDEADEPDVEAHGRPFN